MGILNYFKRSTQTETQTSSKIGYFMSSDTENILVSGYTKLSDSPEVVTAINTVADRCPSCTAQ